MTATIPTVAEARETLKVEKYYMNGERLHGTATLSYWVSPIRGSHTVVCDEMPGLDGYNIIKRLATVEEARAAWTAFRAKLQKAGFVRVK